MARTYSHPTRMLAALAAILIALVGLIAGGVQWGSAQWTPKLALDLAGGTEFVLQAKPALGQEGSITDATMSEAVKIIRQRVNGSGVSEAEVTTNGQDKIIVSLPGKNIDENTKDAIRRSAAMEFRAVLAAEAPAMPDPSPSASPTGSASGSASASSSAQPSGSASAQVTSRPSASSSVSGNGLKLATPSATPTTEPSTTPSASAASGAASPSGSGAASAAPSPTDASDRAWLNTPGLLETWTKTDCVSAEGRRATQDAVNDPAKPLVACDEDGTKYVLGPVEVYGRDITDAAAGLQTNNQGQSTGQWAVNLTFNGTGADAFGKVTTRLFSYQQEDPTRNRFAIVLDNLVLSAPSTNAIINDGRAEITGGFTQDTAQQLANQLKFGALPLSFETLTESEIAATLGDEQLQRGLLAGLIGLILVVLYSLIQYRALGLVTVGSLVVAGLLTYLIVTLLSWRQGYRLSLAGIAGLIVAIGITADSFIVYFERIRDEVREGRPLQTAVELAWNRAKRTILISDAVSLVAAGVLYFLAVGGVRGFAFTLGLTTVVDVLVVFLFTKPIVTLLARTKFFGSGHKFSGFDAEHLGRQVTYTGRGTTRSMATGRPTAKKAAAAGATSAAAGPAKSAPVPATPAPVDTTDDHAVPEDLVHEEGMLEPAYANGHTDASAVADGDALKDPFHSQSRSASEPAHRGMTIAERKAAERARLEAAESAERNGGTAVIEEND